MKKNKSYEAVSHGDKYLKYTSLSEFAFFRIVRGKRVLCLHVILCFGNR